MRDRRELARHDAFTGVRDGLGPWVGWVYSRLPRTPEPLEELFPVSTPGDALEQAVTQLQGAGLATLDARGHVARTASEARDSFAAHVGTDGTLDERAAEYDLESELWSWWVDESMWTTRGGRNERRRQPRTGESVRRRPGQRTLAVGQPSWADREQYPRRRGGRRDHRAARRQLEQRTRAAPPR